MSEIHIQRAHALGREAALQLARDWQAQAERDWGLSCTAQGSEELRHITFERPGLQGSLKVDAASFELRLTLGFLLSAYRGRIETELLRRLDARLGPA